MQLKEIKGVFKQPKKSYHLGIQRFGTPYFYPINYLSSIIYIRKLKLKPWVYQCDKQSDYTKCYSNLPMVRRNKYWIIKDRYIEIGFPIYFYWYGLGWKDKFETPRFEWPPAFHIYFFGLQFCIHWNSPDKDNDQYYEQILWWKYYCNKDVEEAKETWPWNCKGENTWNNKYLI